MNFRTVLMGSADRSTDQQIFRRVRAELGRVSSHSHAIEVSVSNGEVTLRGPVLNVEVADILSGVDAVRGVRGVHYELDGYASAEDLPSWRELRGKLADRAHDHESRSWMPAAGAAVTAAVVATSAWATLRTRA